VKVIVGFI
jgi:hypothetical protein